MNFENKTAISTGAASGMGLLFAENFASLGGNVVMCDVNESILNEKVANINEKGIGRAIGVVCDVRDYGQVCEACSRVAGNYRPRTFCCFRKRSVHQRRKHYDRRRKKCHASQ